MNPELTKAQKQGLVAQLITLVNSDGLQLRVENLFLLNVANTLNLSIEEVQEVNDAPEQFPLEIPSHESARMTMLYYALFLARSDQMIVPEEEAFLHEFGFKLGFNPNLVSDLIVILKQHLNEDVPHDKMIERIRAYLN